MLEENKALFVYYIEKSKQYANVNKKKEAELLSKAQEVLKKINKLEAESVKEKDAKR